MAKKEYIQVRGARANNLQNVDVAIPRGEFVVVTGLSGSGKSSLAFDTIYAEGQRRYMDTLSTYAKHFMGILEKPEVEEITGLSPIIAIEQKTTGNNPRSTVGTITEIYDFLRLLYAKGSRAFSPETGKEMVRYTDEQIVDLVLKEYAGKKCYLLAPLVRGRKGHYRELFDQLRKRGYTEVRIDAEILPLQEVDALDRYKPHFIELVVDRLKPQQGDDRRIRESVSRALNIGKGSLAILEVGAEKPAHFSKHLVDPESGISLQEPQPHSFSFNSPQGYCPHCKGLGSIVDVNIDTIIPDRSKSVADGGIAPLGKVRENRKFDIIRAIARKYNFSLYDPIDALPDEAVSLLVYGSEDLFRVGEGNLSEMESWGGVLDNIEDLITAASLPSFVRNCSSQRIEEILFHYVSYSPSSKTQILDTELDQTFKCVGILVQNYADPVIVLKAEDYVVQLLLKNQRDRPFTYEIKYNEIVSYSVQNLGPSQL